MLITMLVIISRRSPILATDDFSEKSGVWCWKDICPGYTTLDDAKAKLKGATIIRDAADSFQIIDLGTSYTFLADFQSPNRLIRLIAIHRQSTIFALGYAVLRFGMPMSTIIEPLNDAPPWTYTIRFRYGVSVTVKGLLTQIEPHSSVVTIGFSSDNGPAYEEVDPINWRPWHGFESLPFPR
jgi:hypothetical protein